MALTSNISFYPGEDVLITGTIYDTSLVVVDITGWSMTFTIFPGYGRAAVITKTVGAGITLTTPTSGVFTITLAAADSANLTPGTYHLSLERTDSGFDTVLTTGNCTLNKKT